MNGLIKIISQIASIILTVVSCAIFVLALGAVEVSAWSWGGFFALVGAVGWLTWVLAGYNKRITKEDD